MIGMLNSLMKNEAKEKTYCVFGYELIIMICIQTFQFEISIEL